MSTIDAQSAFFKCLSNESTELSEIDKASKAVLLNYKSSTEKLSLEINGFSKKVAIWIKEHSNSKLLPYAFKLIINLYEMLGFFLEFDLNDYYKTSEKEDEKDPKTLEKSMLEGFENDKEPLIDNPLLNFDMIHITLSLLDNMINKKMHLTHKPLLTLILPIVSIYSVDRKIQAIIRKKKFLKVLLRIFKDILQSPSELSELEIQICCYILHATAKLTFQNRKNQDYLLKKKGYEYLKGVIITSTDMILLQGAISTFANICDTVDARLILWCAGNLPVLLQRVKAATSALKRNIDQATKKIPSIQRHLRDIELNLIAIWKFSIGTSEIIDDCLRSPDFVKNLSELFEFMKKISVSEPYIIDYIRVLGLVVAILRRFVASSSHRPQTIQSFYDNLIAIPAHYINDLTIPRSNLYYSFLFKELSGLIGTLCLDEKIANDLVTCGFLQNLIKIAVVFFENPKFIKTLLGCLINICTTDQIRDVLCNEKELYVLMFNVLDKYDYISFVIDYALKLILNTTPNDIFYKNYASITFLEKLLYLFHCYQFDEAISRSLIKILRIICSRIKALENFEKAIKNYENANKGFNFVTFLGQNMSANSEDPEAVASALLFLSNISQNSSIIKAMIKDNQEFSAFLRSYIHQIKDDPQAFKVVSTSIAYLPLEEIGEFL